MRVGEEWPNKYDLSSLRILGSVGEPLNPEAFEWYYRVIGKNHCPVVDTWWQTETGMQMITTMIGEPMRPGFAGKSFPESLQMLLLTKRGTGCTRKWRISRDAGSLAGDAADGIQKR